MVAHLVRLKLALVRNGLRRSAWQIVGLVVAAFYGLAATVIVVASMAVLSVQVPDIRGIVAVLVGSVLVLGWWVVPLVSFGLDATVDPARFVTFAIPRRSLLTGLALGGLIGIPGVVTAVASASMAFVWWRTPLALLAGVVGAVLGLATCIVGARATTSVCSRLMAKRRVRELLAVAALLPILLIGPLLSQASRWGDGLTTETFERVADVLSWTPVGAAWGIPWSVAEGDLGAAAAKLGIAVGTVVVAALVWDRALAAALVNPVHEAVSARGRGLGWFGRLPATPLGAVTARSLTYWVRDPRYALAIAIVPLLPIFMWVFNPGGSSLLFLGPTAAFLMGWGISADVAYDGTAFWTHLSAPLPGLTDRLGRVLGAGMISVPVVTVYAVGSGLLTDRPSAIPALLGASWGVLLTAYAGASIVSALVVYPVQQPGENPFQTRQGASMVAITSQLLGWLGVIVLSVPEVVLAIVAVTQDSSAAGWAALVVGVASGATLLVIGIRLGGRVLDRNGSDLLRRILAFA